MSGKITQHELSQELLDYIAEQVQGPEDLRTAIYTQVFTATEGQTQFTIDGKYTPNTKTIFVYVSGVKQISKEGFSESSENSVNLAQGVPAGTKVEITWLGNATPISGSHAITHEAGGSDEIDITKLLGYSDLDKRISDIEETYPNRMTTLESTLKGQMTDLQNDTEARVSSVETSTTQRIDTMQANMSASMDATFKKITASADQKEYNVKDYGAKGDGVTDDAPSIQKLLDLALTLGGIKIRIPSGTYALKSILYVYSNTEIEMSKDTVLLRAANTNSMFYNANPSSSTTATLYNGHGNITIKGGTFDANIANFSTVNNTFCGINHCKNLRFEGVTFKNIRDNHAMDINATDGLVVKDCKFLGFRLTNQSRNYVEAIQLDVCTPGSFPAFGVYDRTETKNVLIEGCYFGPSETEGSWATAIGNHGAVHDRWNHNIIIRNNIFDGCTYSGIRAYKWSHVLVEGNVFDTCNRPFAYVIPAPNSASTEDADGVQSGVTQGGEDIKIINNTIVNGNDHGIYVAGYMDSNTSVIVTNKRVTIQGNSIYNTPVGYNSIDVIYAEDVVVGENICEGSRRLLYSWHCARMTITSNTAHNVINHTYLSNCTGASITGNTGQNHNQHGFRIESCSSINVSGNTILDCSIDSSKMYHGVTVLGSSKYVMVANNVITESNPLMLSAVNITADSANCLQSNNLTNVTSS
ncbi:hypothetical protein [Bacillus phage SPO1L1]|nr:hypothetical protein [Bacillus phage SPO1L1]WIT26033.1 hypothetical protein [Bacillus phage SPO1L2]